MRMQRFFEFVAGVYFFIGLLQLVWGPLKRDLDVHDMTNVQKYKKSLFYAAISLSIVLLWVLFLPTTLVENNRIKKIRLQTRGRQKESVLRYSKLGGRGEIFCRRCGFSEKIVSFMHGSSEAAAGKKWVRRGYQCQSCGKFSSADNGSISINFNKCECSGILRSDAVLFCPICKECDLRYELEYLT